MIKKTSLQNILYLLPRHKKNCLTCINLCVVSWRPGGWGGGSGTGVLNKMSDLIKYIIERMVEGTCAVMFHMLKYVPGVQGVDDKVVGIRGYSLAYVADYFKTQGMCIKAVEVDPCTLKLVPDQFKTQEMCKKAVEENLDGRSMVVEICSQ